MEIVIDTSSIIAAIVGEPERSRIIEITAGHTLVGPGSIPWEVGNAFSAMFKQNKLTIDEAKKGLASFDSIPLRYIKPDFVNALELSKQANMYAYDVAHVLQQAENTGKVLIRRKDGRTFALVPEKIAASPLDVPSIKANVTTQEIVDMVREGRER